jgi:dihydrofolate reductase
MSLDGYIADTKGKTDWLVWNWGPEWNWDAALKKYFNETIESVDCILLSRKMAKEGFISHWTNAAKNINDPHSAYAKKINNLYKVVFTKTLEKTEWENVDLAKGDLAEEINFLKNQKGKDMIVYGGGNFVSHLIDENLIDEFQFFINPAAIGEGMRIFNGRTNMLLEKSMAFSCGINVLIFKPSK